AGTAATRYSLPLISFNTPMTIFVTSLSGSKALVNFTIDGSKIETSFVESIVYNIERKVKLRYRSQL
ncbi:MAG: hypothetical protein ACLR39_08420, partial [Oscillospiraceae bacterium]